MSHRTRGNCCISSLLSPSPPYQIINGVCRFSEGLKRVPEGFDDDDKIALVGLVWLDWLSIALVGGAGFRPKYCSFGSRFIEIRTKAS